LPPTIKSAAAEKGGLSITLFERVIKDTRFAAVVRLLDTQYRMNWRISDWASEHMYQGRIKSHPSVAEHTLRDIVRRNLKAAAALRDEGAQGGDGTGTGTGTGTGAGAGTGTGAKAEIRLVPPARAVTAAKEEEAEEDMDDEDSLASEEEVEEKAAAERSAKVGEEEQGEKEGEKEEEEEQFPVLLLVDTSGLGMFEDSATSAVAINPAAASASAAPKKQSTSHRNFHEAELVRHHVYSLVRAGRMLYFECFWGYCYRVFLILSSSTLCFQASNPVKSVLLPHTMANWRCFEN
jgi:hypothetical protein